MQAHCECDNGGLHDLVYIPNWAIPLSRQGTVISASCPHPRPFGRVLTRGDGFLIIKEEDPHNLRQMRMGLGQ